MTAFLAERGFGTLVACAGETPIAVHAPFVFTPLGEGGIVELHVARANPIHTAIASQPRVLLTCMGADAYISPDWYVSENQVPTWNYVAVHVNGTARVMPPEKLRSHVERLSAQFEARLPKRPWTTAKMDERRLNAMLAAIVGIEVEVASLEGQWKLAQHKPAADHAGAVAGLRGVGDPASATIAALMEETGGKAPAPVGSRSGAENS